MKQKENEPIRNKTRNEYDKLRQIENVLKLERRSIISTM